MRVDWRTSVDASDAPATATVYREGLESYAVSDTDAYRVLAHALEPRTPASIADHLVESGGYGEDAARELVDRFVESGFLIPTDDDLFERSREWFEKDWRAALDYQLASRSIEYVDAGESADRRRRAEISSYAEAESPPDVYPEFDEESLRPLPPPADLGDRSLSDVLLSRRTCREFEGTVDLQLLSTLLHYTFLPAREVRERVREDGDDSLAQTLSLYLPFEVYPVVLRGDDVDPGVYKYSVESHALAEVRTGDFQSTIEEIAVGQPWVPEAPVSFLFTADFERYQWRYRHSRAFRNLLMDLAALAHRMVLTTTAVDRENFLTPAIADQEAEALLGIEEREFSEAALYVVSVGE